MPLQIKVTPTHYENLCQECSDRESGELEQLTTTAGKAYYEMHCEPSAKSPCKLTFPSDDDTLAKPHKTSQADAGDEQAPTKNKHRRRRRR